MICNSQPKAGWWCITLAWIVTGGQLMAYESIYQPSPPGTLELKQLPAVTALCAQVQSDYFPEANQLFRRLFDFIRARDIPMSVPVEADMNPGTMRFFLGTGFKGGPVSSSPNVQVVSLPARTVLSVGLRGSYTPATFRKGKKAIENGQKDFPQWHLVGTPYAVYWNGPFLPGFLKRSEVHWPVVPATAQ
jgi:hypothetical protein